MAGEAKKLRERILGLVREFHAEAFAPKDFIPGKTAIPYAGRVFDDAELAYLVDASLDFWLTAGRYAQRFEESFAAFWGLSHASLVSSGSSANLLAVSCLTSPLLGERRLRSGDEVITVAAGFPTTVNPIIQNGLIPVFVDVSIPTWNVDASLLEGALSERTRAVVLAHTLGNPFECERVRDFCLAQGLWLVEDCCDAVGSKFKGRNVGTFGNLATTSFYPAHHMTTGEGGCVLTSDDGLVTLVESFRDWGRDCVCPPGKDNTCGRRFSQELGGLPRGYDHKYVYSHIGYNLKATEMQAAVGLAQLEKLPSFIEARKKNFTRLYEGLSPLKEIFILPEATQGSEPSWFGFPIAVREGAPFDRLKIVQFLEERKIATRLLFGGNLVRQPAFVQAPHRVASSLERTDFVMNNLLWVGVYPGLSAEMIDFMVQSFHDFARVV